MLNSHLLSYRYTGEFIVENANNNAKENFNLWNLLDKRIGTS